MMASVFSVELKCRNMVTVYSSASGYVKEKHLDEVSDAIEKKGGI